MAKIIKIYFETLPDKVLIGRVYHNDDRNAVGTFSDKWCQWFANDLFGKVALCGKNDGDYYGAMRANNGVFEYWIGMLFDSVERIPDGFEQVTVKGGEFGVAWVKGKDSPELYSFCDQAVKLFAQQGRKVGIDSWCIERYNCPRFTTEDENGEVILDLLMSVK